MAKILNIITHPDPLLRRISETLSTEEILSDEMQVFFEDMAKTMFKKDGVGLAAPQVGRNIRVVIINFKDKPLTMINPQILSRSWAKKLGEEGCLSVPNVFGMVNRHRRISVSFLDEKGQVKKLNASDMFARIIQHELDHLDGVLFIDKAENIVKQ
jgi:peptide deformylase